MSMSNYSKTLLTAIIISLSISLLPINTASAALTVDHCEQSIKAANDIYKAAMKNPDYGTHAKAKEVADKHFKKQIAAEAKVKILTRKDGIAACGNDTSKGKKHYAGLFTY